jgi:hypothetical protein
MPRHYQRLHDAASARTDFSGLVSVGTGFSAGLLDEPHAEAKTRVNAQKVFVKV